ncbi:MAG: hypothetical protein Kow00124_00970 [Anaerolineae bacterium]
MTEYIDIRTETTGDPDVMRLITNLDLTAGGPPEVYESPEAGDHGSPLAQALFAVPGLAALTLTQQELLATREPDTPWPDLLQDIYDVLRDFFL